MKTSPAPGGKTANILSRLQSVRATGPDRWQAHCPAHEDKSPSLSIRDAGDGRTLLHCFAGCAVDDILASIGMSWEALYPDHDGRKRLRQNPVEIARLNHCRYVLLIAAADQRQGREHTPTDRAAIADAIAVMQRGGRHG
jgi:hypothetical protein